jgi:hypothetical protein
MSAGDLIASMPTPGMSSGGGGGEDDDRKQSMLYDIVQQLRDDFRERDALYSAYDTVLFQQNEVQIPDNYRKTALEVKSPLAPHIINTVTAALATNPPNVQFDPVAFGDPAQANSTLREKFFEAAWRRQEEEAQRSIFRPFMHSLVAKGEGIIKTVERSKRAWAKYTKDQSKLRDILAEDETLAEEDKEKLYDRQTEEWKRALPYPIASTDVPPDTFYYVKNEDGLTFACEVKTVPFFETLERFQASVDAKGNIVAPSDQRATGLPRHEWATAFGSTVPGRSQWQGRGRVKPLTMVEAWDANEVTYILYGPGQVTRGGKRLGRGTVVKSIKHRYGDRVTGALRGPYFHALGLTTHSRLPEHCGLGILFGFLDLFPMLDSLLTIQANAAFLYGFPAFKETAPQGPTLQGPFGNDQAEGDSGRTRIEPGTLYPRDIAPVDMPRSGVDLDKSIQFVRQFIEMALPNVVSGMVNAEQSGWAITQASQLARLGWQPIIDNAQFALSRRVGFESWLVEKRIREPVHVWGEVPANYATSRARQGWLTVGPDNLNGVHRYRVKLQPETPADRIQQIRTHKELLSLRLEAWNDAVTELGGNPDEVEAAWLLYDLKNDPVIKAELKKRTLQELGIADEEALGKANAEARAVQSGGPGGGPPRQPMPPGPGGPPQMGGGSAPGGTPGQQPGMPPNAVAITPGLPGGGAPMVPPPRNAGAAPMPGAPGPVAPGR